MAEQFDERKRIRVGKTASKAWKERQAGIIVILASGFLCVLVFAGSLQPPAPPAPAATATPPAVALRPTPSLPPAIRQRNERLYLAAADAAGQRVAALDGDTGLSLYAIDGGRDLALSPDGQILYVAHDQALSAHDASSGAQRWRVELAGATQQLAVPPGGAPTILVAPNGRRIYALMRRGDPGGGAGRGEADFALQAFDAQNGARLNRTAVLLHWDQARPPFFSRGGMTLYVPAGKVLFAINTDNGRIEGIGVLPDDAVALQLGSNNTSIYVVADGRIDVLMAGALITAASFPLPLREKSHVTPLVALDPRERLLAAESLADGGAPAGADLILWDTVTLITRTIPLSEELAGFAFGRDGRDLYGIAAAPGGSRIVRYALSGASQKALAAQELARLPDATIVRLVVGSNQPPEIALPRSDYLPADQRILSTPAPPSAGDHDQAAGPTAGPTPPPAAQGVPAAPAPERAPLAWIQVPTNAGFDILAIDGAGKTSLLGHNVAALIERPSADGASAAPLLAFRERAPGRWILRDVQAARDLPLELDPADHLRGCVVERSGGRMACASSPGAFTVISTTTGIAATVTTGDDLRAGTPGAWLDDGIYGYSLLHGSRLLWRLDLGAAGDLWRSGGTFTRTLILVLNENDRFAIGPQRGAGPTRILYSYAGAGELRLRDIATSTNLILGPSSSDQLGLFALSPDGRYAAYLRAAQAPAAGYDLIAANLDTGAQQIWVAAAPIVAGSLAWNQDSDQLLYRTLEPADAPQRERLHVVGAPGGVELGERALPGDTIVQAAFNSRNEIIALVYENLQPALIVVGPDTTARIAVPVSLGQGRPSLAYVP